MRNIAPGVLVKANIKGGRRGATLQPLNPVCIVTEVTGEKFKATVLTGHYAGSTFEDATYLYKALPDDVEVAVRHANQAKRPGDLVVDEEGCHIIVTSVDTVADNKMFAGVVMQHTQSTHNGQFGQHWIDADFKVARRREEIERDARQPSPSELFKQQIAAHRSQKS